MTEDTGHRVKWSNKSHRAYKIPAQVKVRETLDPQSPRISNVFPTLQGNPLPCLEDAHPESSVRCPRKE